MPGFKAVARLAPVVVTAHFTAGEAVDKQVFTADRDYYLEEVIETHVATASSATAMIERCASGTAPASGTDLLASTFALDSTANTPVYKTRSGGGVLSSGAANLIRRGQSLAVDFTGTLTNYEGVFVFVLRPKGNN